MDRRSSVDKFRRNPWVWAGFLLWLLLGLSWPFDVGLWHGGFTTTRWHIVFGLASGSFIGVLLIAALLQRAFQRRWLRTGARLGKRTKILGLAADVVAYAVTYLFALLLLVVVFLQMIGVASLDLPLPMWVSATLFGLLVATSILLGSQLPFVDRSVPDYKPLTRS